MNDDLSPGEQWLANKTSQAGNELSPGEKWLAEHSSSQAQVGQGQVPAPQVSPTKPGLSWGDTALQAVQNFPSSAANFAGSIYNAVAHPVDTAEGIGKTLMGGAENIAHSLTKLAADQAQKNSKPVNPTDAYILQRGNTSNMTQADAVGNFYKDRYGGVENIKNTLANDPVGVLSDASALISGGGSAAKSIASAAGATKVAAAADKVAQVGNTINPLVGPLKGANVVGRQLGSKVGETLNSITGPMLNPKDYVGRGIANTIGEAAPEIANNLRTAPEYVPGSLPTAAQAGGGAALVQTEKALANASPEFKAALAEREAQNNAARWQALNGVAKTPEELDSAQKLRESLSSPLYDAAHANTANVGKAFIEFAKTPAVQEAMQTADKLAKNERVVIKWPSPDDRAIDGKALDYTSRALGDMIESAKRSGNMQQARALVKSKDYLQTWTERYIPGVKDAAQTYAQHSIPVNTMEAGQQIANRLMNSGLDVNRIPLIQMNPYKTALTQAIKAQPYGIEANAAHSLQGIGQDLQRATVSNSIRSPGSDTAYNLSANSWLAKQIYGPNFEGAGNAAKISGAIAAALTGHPIAAGGIITGGEKFGKFVGARLQQHMSDLLLDPKALLPYLENAGAKPLTAREQMVARILQHNSLPVAGAVASGASANP